jgi:hypothetical protein
MTIAALRMPVDQTVQNYTDTLHKKAMKTGGQTTSAPTCTEPYPVPSGERQCPTRLPIAVKKIQTETTSPVPDEYDLGENGGGGQAEHA